MPLSEYEREQLRQIEHHLQRGRSRGGLRLWPPHTSVIWVGITLGVAASVAINFLAYAPPIGLLLAAAAVLLMALVALNRYDGPHD